MLEQQNLFGSPDAYGHAAPSQRHSPTSVAAADAITPVASELRERVFAFLAACDDGATDMEIAAALNMLTDTARARRCELTDAGRVKDSGKTRPSPRGRQATVWVVSP